jgi:hypothetical protein
VWKRPEQSDRKRSDEDSPVGMQSCRIARRASDHPVRRGHAAGLVGGESIQLAKEVEAVPEEGLVEILAPKGGRGRRQARDVTAAFARLQTRLQLRQSFNSPWSRCQSPLNASGNASCCLPSDRFPQIRIGHANTCETEARERRGSVFPSRSAICPPCVWPANPRSNRQRPRRAVRDHANCRLLVVSEGKHKHLPSYTAARSFNISLCRQKLLRSKVSRPPGNSEHVSDSHPHVHH